MSTFGVGAMTSAGAADDTTEPNQDLLTDASLRMAKDDSDSHTAAPFTRAALRSKHSTTVALRFLEDIEEGDAGDFDLGGNPSASNNPMMHKSVADFHMSQLRFPTLGERGRPATSIFDDASESTSQDQSETTRFYQKKSSEMIPATNVFTSRQDLREVDQSVNL
jgi:hypothetical protein